MWVVSWGQLEKICGCAKKQLIGRRGNQESLSECCICSEVLNSVLGALYKLFRGHVFEG